MGSSFRTLKSYLLLPNKNSLSGSNSDVSAFCLPSFDALGVNAIGGEAWANFSAISAFSALVASGVAANVAKRLIHWSMVRSSCKYSLRLLAKAMAGIRGVRYTAVGVILVPLWGTWMNTHGLEPPNSVLVGLVLEV